MNPIAQQSPYKEFLSEKRATQTQESYPNILSLVRKSIGKELIEATEFDLKDFIRGCKDRGVKGTTCQTYKSIIASFYTWAIENKLVQELPTKEMLKHMKKFDTGAKISLNPKALKKEYLEKVLSCLIWEGPKATLKEYKISLVILMGFYEGFRRFEIAKLQWSDIEIENNRIKVFGKGRRLDGDPDYVPLSKTVKERLFGDNGYKTLVDKAGIDSRWVFFHPENPNNHERKETIAYWWKMIGKRAGLPKEAKFSSHIGRHGLCTMLNDSGVSPVDAIKITRHGKVDVYIKRYVKIQEAHTQAQFNKAIP